MRRFALAAALGLSTSSLIITLALEQRPPPNPRTIDDVYEDIATRVPGFAGTIVNEDGSETLLLAKPEYAAKADEEVDIAFYRPHTYRKARRVKVVKYSFTLLRAWYRHIQPLLGTLGIVATNIDELNNRITIGIEDARYDNDVKRITEQLKIPRDAVRIERAERVRTEFQAAPRRAPLATQGGAPR